MENSTDDLSSTANHSSGAGSDNASEESGWTSYIDYFMESVQRQQKQASGAAAPSTTDDSGSSSTLQYGSDCADVGSSRLPALVQPSEASRRLTSLKEGRRRRRRKMLVYDESLEDTATSPISSPKLIDKSRESDANHQKKEDARDEFFHCKKTTAVAELADHNNLTNNGINTTTHMIDDDCAYDNNELRKKRLCLDFHV